MEVFLLERNPQSNPDQEQHPQGRQRIKNITHSVGQQTFDQELDSILPKTDWETHMASARTASARQKAAALKAREMSDAPQSAVSRQLQGAGSRAAQTQAWSQGQGSRTGQNRGAGRGAIQARQAQSAGRGAMQSRGALSSRADRQNSGAASSRVRQASGGVSDRGGRQNSGASSNRGTGQPGYRTAGSSRLGSRPRRPMGGPTPASQLSREFEADERRQSRRPRRKRSNRPAKVIASVVVLLIIIGSVFLITLYGQGSSSNQKGLKLYADGAYTEAVTMFEAALKKDEGNAEYLINLGMAYIALGQYEDALVAFDSAISGTNRSELLTLAKRGSGIVYLSSGHYSKAVDLFKEALSYGGDTYDDTQIDILYYLAEAQARAGDTVGAADSYTKIIEHQEDANAYMLRGLAYQSSGDNTRAEADLKTALNMSKKNYKIYLALYEVLTAQEKGDEAAQILQEALSLGGKTGEDYSNRGIVYMYMEDYANASEAFNTALEKGYNGAYLGLAESLVRQGDHEGAVSQYESYLAVDTTNAAAYNQYGLCLMELSRYEDAQAAFASGLALNDRLVDKELMYNEAITLEYLGDWAGAYEKMQAFVQKYPDDTQGQHELTFLESTQLQ